jgi:hypothetical protein
MYTVDIVACLLKARTVKPAEKAVSRQRLCNATMDCGNLFSARSVPIDNSCNNIRTVGRGVFCGVRAEAI